MSLPESFGDLRPASDATPPPTFPYQQALRMVLSEFLFIHGEEVRQDRGLDAVLLIFRGQLRIPVEGAYERINARLKPMGLTGLLQPSDEGEVEVIVFPGVLEPRHFHAPTWVHGLLLLVTLVTTTVMGAALSGMPPSVAWSALRHWDVHTLRTVLRDGLPFSLTLLTILGVHEMGHYVAARLHGVKVTLPFFIPLPLSGSLGTLGAVIFIRSPLMNRRALFDVGISGPLAGLVVALPLYLVGLRQSPSVGLPEMWLQAGIRRVANPPLLDALASLVLETPDLDRFVFYRHPMALAAWFGVLLTTLNLLPLGQFDGGHVAYALLGRRAWRLAWGTFVVLVVLGLQGFWIAWLLWAFMGLLTGLNHPPPHDDVLPLGAARTVIGIGTALLFLLMFTPAPFYAP